MSTDCTRTVVQQWLLQNTHHPLLILRHTYTLWCLNLMTIPITWFKSCWLVEQIYIYDCSRPKGYTVQRRHRAMVSTQWKKQINRTHNRDTTHSKPGNKCIHALRYVEIQLKLQLACRIYLLYCPQIGYIGYSRHMQVKIVAFGILVHFRPISVYIIYYNLVWVTCCLVTVGFDPIRSGAKGKNIQRQNSYYLMVQLIIQSFPGIFIHILYKLRKSNCIIISWNYTIHYRGFWHLTYLLMFVLNSRKTFWNWLKLPN